MRSPILLVIAFMLTAFCAFGQSEVVAEARKNNIQVNCGVIHSRLIDDGYSRKLLFRGTNAVFSLGYGRQTRQYLFNFSAEGSVGKIESKSGDLSSNYYRVEPSVEYSRNVKHHRLLNRSNTFLAGVSLSSANYFMINEPIFDNASLLSLHGMYLNLSNRLLLDEKQQLRIAYQLPVAVYVNRLLWNGGASDLTYSDQEHLLRTLTTKGSMTWFDVFHNIQLSADYAKRIGGNTDFMIRYRFRYFSNPAEPPLRVYSNQLLIGLKISF